MAGSPAYIAGSVQTGLQSMDRAPRLRSDNLDGARIAYVDAEPVAVHYARTVLADNAAADPPVPGRGDLVTRGLAARERPGSTVHRNEGKASAGDSAGTVGPLR